MGSSLSPDGLDREAGAPVPLWVIAGGHYKRALEEIEQTRKQLHEGCRAWNKNLQRVGRGCRGWPRAAGRVTSRGRDGAHGDASSEDVQDLLARSRADLRAVRPARHPGLLD